MVTFHAVPEDEPCYVISVAARIVGVHAQTLRYYERVGLVSPSRSRGRIRLYSPRDVERLRTIKSLIGDLGVNLAGAEVVLRLMRRISEMEERIESLTAKLSRLEGEGYDVRVIPEEEQSDGPET